MFSLDFLFLSSPLAEDSFGSHFAEGKRTTREPLIKISGSSFFCDCFCRTKKKLAVCVCRMEQKTQAQSAERQKKNLGSSLVCCLHSPDGAEDASTMREAKQIFFGFFFFWRIAFAGWSRSCKHNARSAVKHFHVLLFLQFAFAE